MKIRSIAIETISIMLTILFVYTAVSKLKGYDTFVFQLGRSPYLESFSHIIAWSLPVSEIVIALMLQFKKTKLLGLYTSFALMLAFTLYIYIMLNYAYYVPCSCGGVLENMSWEVHLWFNLAFTLLALTAIILSITNQDERQGKLATSL